MTGVHRKRCPGILSADLSLRESGRLAARSQGLCSGRDAGISSISLPAGDPRQHWAMPSATILPLARFTFGHLPEPEDKCYSGATLVEEDRVIAMYQRTSVGNMVAVSSDPLLLNWEKVTGKAVIPIASADGSPLPYRVFDPCIWKKGGIYYSLSGGTLPAPAAARFGPISSSARRTWQLAVLAPIRRRRPFLARPATTGRAPISGPSAIGIFCCTSAHERRQVPPWATTTRSATSSLPRGRQFQFRVPTAPVAFMLPQPAPTGKGGVIVIFKHESRQADQGLEPDHVAAAAF